MKSRLSCLGLLILAVILAGCATLPKGMEPPRVNIAHVSPKEIKVFEQVFEMQLRIQNRNEMELLIRGLVFDLELNDKPFATGVSNQTVTLGPLSSEMIHVEAITNTWDLLGQVIEGQKAGLAKVKYRLRGKFYVSSPGVTLPFDENGEIEIPLDRSKP